ncbi:glycosyltransferase [Acidovorax carolinensis]|uniref:glycosyltransferase n=1 Tax=Acidovorax carolinensis TaxID=553814 RepID=UPI000B346A27|nr:glycosyltransferase [Acidovorax carolinensis]ART49519.1 hypothetical protein CBP33_16465 [Acidovorax carolinensis]
MHAPQCHVTHLVYRLATGGMENVVVQLIRHLPRTSFRHTVIALCDIDPEFSRRLDGTDVELIALNKPPGQPYALYPTVYRLLRRLRPDVLHSCNLAALEFAPVAALARVPLRVHVEHGLDMHEINGKSARYRMLRRLYRPFVSQYVAVSEDQARQCAQVGAAAERVHLIPNGVDTRVFRPRTSDDPLPVGFPFQRERHWVVGTVGRQADIKNPLLLVDAFVQLVHSGAPGTDRLRLAMVGDGPLHSQIAQRLHNEGLSERAWLPGARSDIADILRAFDCFVLPSLSEATSCALQEAMATGLAIVATHVGGNADVLDQGRCGSLVPSGDATALAAELQRLCASGGPNAGAQEALISVRRRYSLETVIQRYGNLFLNTPAHSTRDVLAQQPAPPQDTLH